MSALQRIQLVKFQDQRGTVLKPRVGIDADSALAEIRDAYVTQSVAGAFRGFHYQVEPFAQTKVFGCLWGNMTVYAVDPSQAPPRTVDELAISAFEGVVAPRGWATATFTEFGATYAFFSDAPYAPDTERTLNLATISEKFVFRSIRIRP